MDFNPTDFLSMAMTEDQDAVYTAPDIPETNQPGSVFVEGGLQMEQGVQIPVPTFGLLQHDEVMEQTVDEDQSSENGLTTVSEVEQVMQIDITEPDNCSSPQPSPVERTPSPCTKKIIQTSYEETRFRKDFYCGNYDRVKIFRLHCSICDKHLGCAPWFTGRQMRIHKLLNVAVCRHCFEFYGDINFPIDEGSELYCCWCGEGGECFCCSTCPKIICKKCIKRNFGAAKLKEIDKIDEWCCFVCKPEEIWPHRALLWGLQRWGKQMRQLVVMLPKEEKVNKLSKDTSHCCLKSSEKFDLVGLPPRLIISKIPMCLIAGPYQTALSQWPQQSVATNTSNGMSTSSGVAHNVSSAMNNLAPVQQPRGPPMVQTILPMIPQGQPVNFIRQQMINRYTVNRPISYPINRQVAPVSRPPYPQTLQHFRQGPQSSVQQYRITSQLLLNKPAITAEVIDLVQEPPLKKQALQKPTHDIAWLDKGIRDVREALTPTMMMMDQFKMIRNGLESEFTKLTNFSDRLSYNIKIAICNLAKINQDIVDSQKKIIDNQVSSVVGNIQLNGISKSTNTHEVEINPVSHQTDTKKPEPPANMTVNSNSPQRIPEPKGPSDPTQTTPTSTEEDVGHLTAAMLCETVFEVEDNKENENGNKDQSTPVKKTKPRRRGKPISKSSPKRPSSGQNSVTGVHVIDLVDEDDDGNKFNELYYLKKFNIKPCKVVVQKSSILN